MILYGSAGKELFVMPLRISRVVAMSCLPSLACSAVKGGRGAWVCACVKTAAQANDPNTRRYRFISSSLSGLQLRPGSPGYAQVRVAAVEYACFHSLCQMRAA